MPTLPITQEQVAGLIRHVVTVLGTLFVARGWAAGAYLDLVAGTVATLGGAIWSFVVKAQAAPTPEPPKPPTIV